MELKKAIAKNLVNLRTQSGMTQAQLAEKLNYSDKAVSKWERGEAIPDISVFLRLSELYGVSLDDMVRGDVAEPGINPEKKRIGSHAFIVAMSSALVWFVATCVYIVFYLIPALTEYAYLAFVPAPFVTAIVCIVFSGIWGNWITNIASTSSAVWFGIVTAHVFVVVFAGVESIALLYLAGAVFQVLVFLWFGYRKFINYFKHKIFDNRQDKKKK